MRGCFQKMFGPGIILWGVMAAGTLARAVDYSRDVKPILAQACYDCHGPDQQKSGLRLDTAAWAQHGGKRGPAIQPGNPEESLILQAVQGTHSELPRMPFKREPLSAPQIETLRVWIEEGAPAPADEKAPIVTHWSFLPPQRPPLPEVKQKAWPKTAIDFFILARLEREDIRPSPPADRVTLIRRLSLDLTGLPPAPSAVDALVRDSRPDAYERLVDRLLESPHYGERWGRHWLDVARYADSNGYSIDAPRSIWRYRDWVIQALNEDLPFDQFVIDQLAGDLLPEATLDQRIATGFHRNTQINQEGGIDPEQFRVESVLDRVNTTGTAFLGLTIGCAQCHDHKFDPISQTEYYQLFAFFNDQEEPTLETPTAEEEAARRAYQEQVRALERELKVYEDGLSFQLNAWEQSLDPAARSKFKPAIQAILDQSPDRRTEHDRQELFEFRRDQDEGYRTRRDRLAKLKKQKPSVTTTMVLRERSQPRTTHVHIKGDFTRPGEVVEPAFPAVLLKVNPSPSKRRLNRLDLARWLVDPRNPLTARVTVNRVWQQYFGRGLVETENDFGNQGARPSHPELLDWLATEFMGNHWSLKSLHRLIVTSATYRQSSRARPDLAMKDPDNRLLARQSRLRLDAEVIRDMALAASGLLSLEIGGPSVYPPQPEGVMALGQSHRAWKASAGPERFRRGLYTFFWRATPHPALAVFDAPDAFSTCTRRLRSNTPLQALTLLNDQQYYEQAQGLARRVLAEGPHDNAARLEYAFRLCLARTPSAAERSRLTELLNGQELSGEQTTGAETFDAWTTVARVLLNLDETITRE
jgi:Protein of unknown function (DUF1553)/Protein of unknown function (DUF1549)/Planctomycete cytochrome C